MEKYKNLSGNSEVSYYETGITYIKIQFKDGSVYLYNNVKPGLDVVRKMQLLAAQGCGLNSYINLFVKHNYAYKVT